MKDLPGVRWLLRLLVNPGWAPLGVVIMHVILAEFGLTRSFDHVLHFLGGASIAYFLFGFVALVPSLSGSMRKWVQYFLAFTSSCTVALFWEFAEFASDRFMGTSIQQGVSETMLDLVFGVAGAFSTLLLIGVFRAFGKGRPTEAQQGRGQWPVASQEHR